MKLITVLLITLLSSACSPITTTSTAYTPAHHCTAVYGKADRVCTPGATNPDVTQSNIKSTICVPGWTKTVRPPTSYTNLLKTSQMQDYGDTGLPKDYEEDHLIPLAVGGHPRDHNNLWPEPWNGSDGARRKDVEEVKLQKAVCSGQMTLADAQAKIVQDWTH